MKKEQIDLYDSLNGYCPMLGHMLSFHYCRGVNDGLPCRKVMDCWHDRLPVHEFLAGNFTESELNRIFEHHSRLDAILDVIHEVEEMHGLQ